MKHQATRILLSSIVLGLVILAAHFAVKNLEASRNESMPMQVRLMSAISDSGGAIVEVEHATSRIIRCTPKLEEMLGYPTGSLAGEQLDILMPRWFREAHKKLLSTYRPEGSGSSAVMRCWMLKSDGSTVEVVVSVFLSSTDRLVALVSPSKNVRFRDMLALPSDDTASK